MNVLDFLKKSVAFSVGAAAFSAEKMKQFADEMVARGEMSSEEATKFVDEMTTKAEDEKKTFQDWMRDQVSKMLQQIGAAELEKVQALERRVAALESRVAELSMADDLTSEEELERIAAAEVACAVECADESPKVSGGTD